MRLNADSAAAPIFSCDPCGYDCSILADLPRNSDLAINGDRARCIDFRMTSRERPLSPFLIYRFDYTMVLSFSHRASGVVLAAGGLILVTWLLALANGPASYTRVVHIFGSWYFRLLLLGWLFSFFFHLVNGIRHLVWDLGYGFEKPHARLSGWIALIAALLMTGSYAWLASMHHGIAP